MDIKDRRRLAQRVAHDIPEGSYVNLGIGLPTLVADYFGEKQVILQSENGVLGQWMKATSEEHKDYDLVDASKEPIKLKPGGAFFHHADSFGIMRGGHLDYCILGAFQVSASGDLANWHTGGPDAIPGVGGAMDLASGTKNVYVIMELCTKDGKSKILPKCTYPLTGLNCVNRVYTDYATFEFENDKLYVLDLFDGHSSEEIEAILEFPLYFDRLKAK